MIKNISCLILFTLVVIAGISQTVITGKINGVNDVEGLAFATIKLSNEGKYVETISDLEGRFIFDSLNFESVELEVAYVGYHKFDTVLILGSKQINLKIELQPTTDSIVETYVNGYSEKIATENIAEGKILIILPGGLLGAPELDNDSLFENKYKVHFFSPGCGGSLGALEYNLTIFKHLDEKYGNQWRMEIRTDAIGIKN